MRAWESLNVTPMITWQPIGVNYSDILNGSKDAYLTASAQALKAFGYPVFLRPFHEFNQRGNTYGLANQGASTTADQNFIAMWRHMVNIFRSVGATNVKWVWCFANKSVPDDTKNPWNNPVNAYPGDAYVDWVAFDAFNRDSLTFVPYDTFDQLVAVSYPRAISVPANGSGNAGPPTTRPVMISEIGVDEFHDGGAKKAAFITQMFNELPTVYPHLRSISYFDYSPTATFNYALTSTPLAEQAWISGIRTVNMQHVLNYRGYGVPLNQITSWQ
jgi:beta-mannanase